MLGRALSYLVLFSTLGIILRWSYGISLLSNADGVGEEGEEEREINGRLESGRAGQPNGLTQTQDGDNVLEAEEGHDVDTPLITENGAEERQSRLAQRPVARSPRFSEGPVTIGRPPSLTRADQRRHLPTRRWTALGNNDDIDDTEVFHKPIYVPNPRNFRKDISNFRSFPNTPSRTPAASSYATSSNGSYDSERDGDETETGDTVTASPYNEDDDTDVLGEESGGSRRNGEFSFGMGRRKKTEPSRNRWQAAFRRNRRQCWTGYKKWVWRPLVKFMKGVQAFMTAPLYAALLSLIVACIPPVQRVLDEMLPLRNAIKSAGNCSVPITLIVLGSYFVEEPDAATKAEQEATKHDGKKKGRKNGKAKTSASSLWDQGFWEGVKTKLGEMVGSLRPNKVDGQDGTMQKKTMKPKSRPGETRTIFVSVVSRMVVAPLVLIPILYFWSVKTRNIADDPVFAVTATLVIGSAPAITLAQMTTASASGKGGGGGPGSENAPPSPFERLISKTLFVSYVFVTFPSTIILVLLGLEIAKAQ